MPVCPACQTPNPDFANFCTVCGQPLTPPQPAPVILPPKLPAFPMRWHKVYSGFLLPLFSILCLLNAALTYTGLTHLFEDPPEEALSLTESCDLGMALLFLSLSILLLALRRKLRRMRYGALAFHNTLCLVLAGASVLCLDFQLRAYSGISAAAIPLLMLFASLLSLLIQTLYYGRKRKILFTA